MSGLILHGRGLMLASERDHWDVQWKKKGVLSEMEGSFDSEEDDEDEETAFRRLRRTQGLIQERFDHQIPFDQDGGCPLKYLILETSPDVSLISTSD